MKAAIERRRDDLTAMLLLCCASLLHRDVGVVLFARQQMVVTDKTRAVFKHEQQPAELIRSARFAAAIELRVRLEQAEQLVAVGDFLLQDHAPIGRVANLFREREPMLQVLRHRPRCRLRATGRGLFLQGLSPLQKRFGSIQQLLISSRQSLLHAWALARTDLGDRPHADLDAPIQMLALPPTRRSHQLSQLAAQGNDLPHAVANQRTFRRVMNVRFHDERIRPHALSGRAVQRLAVADDRVAERCQRRRLQLTERVTNPPRAEARLGGAPLAQAEQRPQRSMILRLVLQLVVIEVAPQANRGQHDDLPIVEAGPSHVAARFFIDVRGDQLHDFPPQFTAGIDVLQPRQDCNHLVATLEVERQFANRCRIKTPLL